MPRLCVWQPYLLHLVCIIMAGGVDSTGPGVEAMQRANNIVHRTIMDKDISNIRRDVHTPGLLKHTVGGLQMNSYMDLDNYTITEDCTLARPIYDSAWNRLKPWAQKMRDADGKEMAGMWEGALHWIGSYEECMRQKATHEEIPVILPNLTRVFLSHAFDAQYCRTWTDDEMSFGTCLPENCTKEDVAYIIYAEWRAKQCNITYVNCGERKPYEEDVGAITATVILCLLGVLIIIATTVDYIAKQTNLKDENRRKVDINSLEYVNKQDTCLENGVGNSNPTFTLEDIQTGTKGKSADSCKSDQNVTFSGTVENDVGLHSNGFKEDQKVHSVSVKALQALTSFSLYTNAPKMLSTRMPKGAYLCMNGLRFFAMCWIVLGHTWQIGIYIMPDDYIATVDNSFSMYQFLMGRWTHYFINSMHLGVEIFFVLSASLVTISFLKQLERQHGKPSCRQMALYYFHRYWRLTPVYMIILMIFGTLFIHWCEGPLFPVKNKEVDDCGDHWWTHMLYINNYLSGCMGWTWYLALDFQYYVVAPIFILSLAWKPVFGCILLSLMVLGQLAATITYEAIYEDVLRTYLHFECRIGSYAIGIALGYIMFRTKCKVKIPKIAVAAGWLVALTLCCLAVYGNIGEENWNNATRAVFYGSYRDVFSFGIAWIIFACCSGYGGVVNRFLSWSVFVPLSRLTYVGYLIHSIIIYFHYFNLMRLIYVQDLTMIMYFCGHLLLTIVISFAVSLAFEVPFLQLEKVIIPSPKNKNN